MHHYAATIQINESHDREHADACLQWLRGEGFLLPPHPPIFFGGAYDP